MHLFFPSDSSLMISVDEDGRIPGLFRLLAELRDERIRDLHPAYRTLQIDFDPRSVDPVELLRWTREVLAAAPASTKKSAGAAVEIPVVYGGEHGPDLETLATTLGLSPARLIALHADANYEVAFLGFSPGFPYLTGLPPDLRCRRRESPRLRVEPGSVAIAGLQAGIYPAASPGGWQLLGRTNVPMFDPLLDAPARLLPGDRVRFVPVRELDFPQTKNLGADNPAPGDGTVSEACDEASLPVLEVLNPGTLASLQDEGRYGRAHLGVSAGGAADPRALALGNRLLGNDDFAPAIELTAWGGSFRFPRDAWFCLTGADAEPTLNGQPVTSWTTYLARAGETLSLGALRGGLRAYLCLRGGIAVPRVLGSASTDLGARWGGHAGRALRSGDLLHGPRQLPPSPGFRRAGILVRDAYAHPANEIRVTPGPQVEWFTTESRHAFFSAEFTVSTEANRQGLRLDGVTVERIPARAGAELLTEGIANGAIQIAGGGQPMILFCEQRTTGGYPKIANVIAADLPLLGRLAPGGRLRFREVPLEEAWRIARESPR